MLTYVQGDLFTSPASVLTNTVNTVGVMGKGIAKDFKYFYPEMFTRYQQLCEADELTIGTLCYYRAHHKSVLNFPTKRHWRQRSRLEDIEAGLVTFVNTYTEHSISSIAFPQLGCGNGELDWEGEVRPLMEEYLRQLPIDIYIHIYDSRDITPEHRNIMSMKKWLRSEPQSLAFSEVWEDLTSIVANVPDDGATHGWKVAVQASEEDPALIFESEHRTVVYPKFDLQDIWQQLRSYGLFSVSDLPNDYRDAGQGLNWLLCQLPYIEPTNFDVVNQARGSTTSELLSSARAQGVRLVLPTVGHEEGTQAELLPLMVAS